MTISVEIDEALGEEIRRLAELDRRTPEAVVREAVGYYARRLDAKLDFQREADESWGAYGEDGLHLTGEEVAKWLGTVGTDDESELPECHK